MSRPSNTTPVLDRKSLYKRVQSFPRDTLQRYNRLSKRSKVSQLPACASDIAVLDEPRVLSLTLAL